MTCIYLCRYQNSTCFLWSITSKVLIQEMKQVLMVFRSNFDLMWRTTHWETFYADFVKFLLYFHNKLTFSCIFFRTCEIISPKLKATSLQRWWLHWFERIHQVGFSLGRSVFFYILASLWWPLWILPIHKQVSKQFLYWKGIIEDLNCIEKHSPTIFVIILHFLNVSDVFSYNFASFFIHFFRFLGVNILGTQKYVFHCIAHLK